MGIVVRALLSDMAQMRVTPGRPASIISIYFNGVRSLDFSLSVRDGEGTSYTPQRASEAPTVWRLGWLFKCRAM